MPSPARWYGEKVTVSSCGCDGLVGFRFPSYVGRWEAVVFRVVRQGCYTPNE